MDDPARRLRGLLRPLARRWLQQVQAELDLVPHPEDAARQTSSGPAADRVLLVGNGPVIGFGVRSHELAIPGQLARRLTAITGRGAVVDVVPKRGLRVEQAAAALRERRIETYDAVVLAIGSTDAAGLTPASRWEQALGDLLGTVRATVAADTAILLLPAAPLQRTGGTAGRGRRMSDAHAERLDAVTAALCAARGDVETLEGDGSGAAPRTSSDYSQLADRIAARLAPRLDALVASGSTTTARARRRGADPELLRQGAVDRSGLVGSGTGEVLDRLLHHARDLFGASAAAVTLVDGEDVVFKAALGLGAAPGPVPRAIAPCNLAIRQDGVWVADDLGDHPITEHGWRFYAGHPLESPDGWRIGTLCVLDRAPRRTTEQDGVALTELASRVQAALWREIEERSASGVPTSRPAALR